MLKRVFKTFLIFVGVLFLGMMFCNIIENGTFIPVKSLIGAVIGALPYLIMVFIYTRKHPDVYFFIAVIAVILYILPNQKYTPESNTIISISFIFGCFMGFIEGNIAAFQVKEYKEKKEIAEIVEKNLNKIEFEEISPDGKITRIGKLEKLEK